MHCKRNNLFNKQCWENKIIKAKIILRSYLISYTKIKSTWTKDLNARPDILKFLEKNIRDNLFHVGVAMTSHQKHKQQKQK